MFRNLASIHLSTYCPELRIQIFCLDSHSTSVPVQDNIQDNHPIARSNMSPIVLKIQRKEVFKYKE